MLHTMGVRKPKTLKQMVKITGMDEKELEKQYPIIPDHDERGDE